MKYFIVSDCHSFLWPLKEALAKAGFDKKNTDHVLIINGDIFDRGYETKELYRFIKSIPEGRRILIKGNHEDLYFDLLEKDYPERHDFSNGTVRTFCQIADSYELQYYDRFYMNAKDTTFEDLWKNIVKKVKKSAITKWLKSDEWINYFEIGDYIITHSFIPVRIQEISETKWCRYWPVHSIDPKYLEPVPEWRTKALKYDWSDSRWPCPYAFYDDGLFDQEKAAGKTLICGHWHTNDFHEHYEKDTEDIIQSHNYNIYYGNNLIAIDGCVAHTKMQNVLVIENGKVINL